MLPSERYHERSVLTEPLAHAVRTPDDVSCSGVCLSDAYQQASGTLAASPW
jgi:hypothetical protein